MDGPKGIDISQMTSAFAVVKHPQLVIDSLSAKSLTQKYSTLITESQPAETCCKARMILTSLPSCRTTPNISIIAVKQTLKKTLTIFIGQKASHCQVR